MDGFVRRNVEVPRRLGQPSLNPLAAGPGAISGATGLARANTPPAAGSNDLRGLGKASMLASNASAGTATAAAPPSRRGVSRGDIDDSLKAIDKDLKRPNKYDPYKKARKRKLIKRIILVLLLLAALGGAYFGIRAFLASTKVFKGNIFEALTQQNTPLQKDGYGRTNILIFGTSEDDGPNHGGANLTDSIMILSIDQDKKTASMMSVPRDLWVQYDKSCVAGYAGKINAVFECSMKNPMSTDLNDQNTGALGFASKINEIFGVNIQYYVHVNYKVVRDVVNAVGGVDVNIQSTDPRGVLDRNFDWTCNYKCYLVKYPNGVAHLDGAHALALARARNDAGGYGLSRGNFDREVNQQKILRAVQTKALAAGTLSNPITALNLINSLGDNIRTNFQTKEITTLINLAKQIKPADITTIDLLNKDNPLVTTGTGPDGSSIVKPVAGLLDYSGLQAYTKAIWSGDTSVLEHATVAVFNGSQTAGVASSTASSLKKAGFTIGTVNDATTNYAPKYTLYDQSGGKKPVTLSKLETQLGVKVTAGKPKGLTTTEDFVVVVGTGTASSSSSSSTSQ